MVISQVILFSLLVWVGDSFKAPDEWFVLQTGTDLGLALTFDGDLKQLIVDHYKKDDSQHWGWSEGRLINKKSGNIMAPYWQKPEVHCRYKPMKHHKNQLWQLKGLYVIHTLTGNVLQIHDFKPGQKVFIAKQGPRPGMIKQNWEMIPYETKGVALGFFCAPGEPTLACGSPNSKCMRKHPDFFGFRCRCKPGYVRAYGPIDHVVHRDVCVPQKMLAAGAYCSTEGAPCGDAGSKCHKHRCIK